MGTFAEILAELKLVRDAFTNKKVWAGLDHGGKTVSLIGQLGESIFEPAGGNGPVLFGGAPLTAATHQEGLVCLADCLSELATMKALASEHGVVKFTAADGTTTAFDWTALLTMIENLLVPLIQAWIRKKIGV